MLFNTLLGIVLSVSGVLSQSGWGVTYTPERICALKGSSVDMHCTYSYPTSGPVLKTSWFIQWNKPQEPEDLSKDPEYSHRVKYLGNKHSVCTFKIKQLKESDSAIYRFRFLTNSQDGKYTGQPGVSLTVTGLQVKVTENEAQSVTLTCSSTCTLSGSPTFTWYKNGQFLRNTAWTYQQNDYLWFTASSGHAGSYSCAVRGHANLPSPAVTLYAPKNTSVSVSPSGEIVEGRSVTLTCSSDANPPVQRYTWYKKIGYAFSRRGSQRSYTINKVNSSDAGEYYCGAENAIGTDRSPHINLKVQYPPKNTSVSVSPSGEIVEDSSVTLTCSSDANPPVQRYTWYKKNETGVRNSEFLWRTSQWSYTIKNLTLQDAGEYFCEAENGIGTNRSPPKRLDVQYAPKNTSVSVTPSVEIVEGSSVTLTCSSDANPPVQNYTWFKKNDTGAWQAGSGQSLNFSNFRSWNRGQYYCEAQNRLGAQNASALLVTVQEQSLQRVTNAASDTNSVLQRADEASVWD